MKGAAVLCLVITVSALQHDPTNTFVDVRVADGMEAITVHERSDALWKIEIDTFPEDFSWEWYKEDGTQIRMTGSGINARYSHTVNGLYHNFNISNVGIDDSGNYTLRISTAFDTTNITLCLRVVGAPFILPVSAPALYSPGSLVNFSALTFGLPLPTVEWIYKEYPDFPSKENSRHISLSDVYIESVENAPYRMMSHVNLMINRTGDLICVSCNEINCTHSTKQIFVSDVANGAFGISGPEQVTEGDDITIACSAPVHYSNRIRWSYRGAGRLSFESPRVNLTEQKTNFTLRSLLQIRGVQKSDSGQYTCMVQNTEWNDEKFAFKLSVEDMHPQPPELIHSNMNDSEIFIDMEKSRNKHVILECYVVGRPIPKVTWYKNGELLAESKQYRFSNGNSTFRIEYFSDPETDTARYTCIGRNHLGTVRTFMDITVADPGNIVSSVPSNDLGPEKQNGVLNHSSYENPGMSLDELQRVLLTKQIRAAEAQERAAISVERLVKRVELLIEQFSDRFSRN